MITRLCLGNFRSIVEAELELSKINILTGANNSGKSSIIYGLLALKNVVLNSNQSLDACLTPFFINLGGFSQTVYLKNEESVIELGVEVSEQGIRSHYQASLGKKSSHLCIYLEKPKEISLDLEVSFPYPVNRKTGTELKFKNGLVKITWDGIAAGIAFQEGEAPQEGEMPEEKEIEYTIGKLSHGLNAPAEALRMVDFLPLRRGFTKPVYSSVPLQLQLSNEDEFATLLAADRDLEGKVAHYLEKLVDRLFNVRAIVGTSAFNLQSRNRDTGLVCDLVNEGFGTNQLVTILAKCLRKEVETICIEEAEIHLHPSLMDGFVDVLIQIAKNEGKSFIISTHSEHIVLSLLNHIAKGAIKPSDVNIHYLSKKENNTTIEKQHINEKGQIEGGLKSFYEVEMKQAQDFFGIPKDE